MNKEEFDDLINEAYEAGKRDAVKHNEHRMRVEAFSNGYRAAQQDMDRHVTDI